MFHINVLKTKNLDLEYTESLIVKDIRILKFVSMIKQKIFNCIILIIIISSFSSSQTRIEEEPKSYFWGLIRVPNDNNSEKVPIYDRLFRYREFAAPINYMPIEMRYGLGVTGKLTGSSSALSAGDLDNWIWLDSDITPLDQSIENIAGTSLDIDFGMINIPNLIMKTSWMNILTGFNYRSSSIFSPKSIPDDWKEGTSLNDKTIQFKPDIKEYLITNSLQWQPYNSWYLNLRYGYGLAFSKFYFDKDLETMNESPKGSGTSMSIGFGFRYIIDPGKLNRFSIGLDLRHSYTKINKIEDPNDVTPVNRFDIANYGLHVTLSTFYGGKKTTGDEAKSIYYNKDYIGAKRRFLDFINSYPNHSNKYRAMKFIENCNKRIPYQIMEEGLYFDDIGDSEKALDKYIKARARVITNDSLIVKSLNFRIDEIARKWMNSAELLLDRGFYKEALSLIKKVSQFSEVDQKVIDKFNSYVILEQGQKLQSILIFGKAMKKYAEALKLNGALQSNIRALQYQAGIQLVELADKVKDFDEIVLAIQSLEEASELTSSIGPQNERLLKDLKFKLNKYSEYKSKMIIDYEMSKARYIQAVARAPRLTVGMTLPFIEELLGKPHDKVISTKLNQKEQLWIYFLKDKKLELSFKDFILFKVEEK